MADSIYSLDDLKVRMQYVENKGRVEEVIPEGRRTVYLECLEAETGITEKQLEEIHSFDGKFIPAAVKSGAEAAIEYMAGHRDVKSVEFHVGMGPGESIKATTHEKREFPIPGRKGERTTVCGYTSVDVSNTFTERRGAHSLEGVFEEIAAIAVAKLNT